MVLEFLGSSVDLSLAGPIAPDGSIASYAERYGADADALRTAGARPRPPASATRTKPGHHHAPDGRRQRPPTVAQPVKVDNDLYVRDYSKCILCYKCVEACGEDAQNTFAIAVAGRGFDARISTEEAVPLPDSACVYCGNCIGVCPTGALMFKSEYDMRAAGTWDESRPDRDRDDLPVLRRRLRARRSTSRTTGSSRSTSPLDSSVTDGHLCIKGRFGFEFVHNRRTAAAGRARRAPSAGSAASAEPAQVAQVDPVVVGVDVEAVAAQEADERHAEPLGGLDGEVRRRRHGADDRDAGDGRLLDDLEADPARRP